MKGIIKNVREYENLHIALWLIKDTCWVMSLKVPGMLMIIPTLIVAVHLAYKSRKSTSDLFHNIAVCLWITANATWMTGEFFFADGLRPYAMVLFGIGLCTVAVYYVVYFPKRKEKELHSENAIEQSHVIGDIEELKVARA